MSKMKNSGVEWIGDIPEDWEIKKLNYCFDLIGSGTTPKSQIDDYYNGNFNWLQSGDIHGIYVDKTEKSVYFEANDVLFRKLQPYLAKVYLAKDKGCCSTEFSVIRPKETYSSSYLWCLLISKGFVDQVDFSTFRI